MLIASVVAGSPGSKRAAGYTVLNTLGNSVPGSPAAISARPDNGPNENMNVCVPFAMVE